MRKKYIVQSSGAEKNEPAGPSTFGTIILYTELSFSLFFFLPLAACEPSFQMKQNRRPILTK